MRKVINVILIIALVGVLTYLGTTLYSRYKAPPIPKPTIEEPIPEPDTEKEVPPSLHGEKYTIGDLGPDKQRIDYKSGSMILNIPKLDYKGPVLSVDLSDKLEEYSSAGLSESQQSFKLAEDIDEMLDNGVVLFNQSYLPSSDNANVSIAGHRDFRGEEFYYIDMLEDGDKIYLEYKGKRYTYAYEKTIITNESDWEPVKITDKSQITLQSCDPILPPDRKYNRIFVTGILIDVSDI